MLAALLISLRVYYVMQYAPLEEINFTPSTAARYAVEISYVRQATGKVEFLRLAADQTETLIEHGENAAAPLSALPPPVGEGWGASRRGRRSIYLNGSISTGLARGREE